MTIKNLTRSVSQGTMTLAWEGDQEFTFVYQDAVVVGVVSNFGRTWSGPNESKAVYQVIDSPTSTPAPPPTDPVPGRYAEVKWPAIPEAAKYIVQLNGQRVATIETELTEYTYTSPWLPSGQHNIKVLSYDAPGNTELSATSWVFEIGSIPPPVQSIDLADGTNPGDITLTLTPPQGW